MVGTAQERLCPPYEESSKYLEKRREKPLTGARPGWFFDPSWAI
jgi:hypothetical protein